MGLTNHDIFIENVTFLSLPFFCTKFDGHLKRQSFKTSEPGCICKGCKQH